MKNFLFILFFSYKIIGLHSQDENSNFSHVSGRNQLYSFLYYTICPNEGQVVNGINYDKTGIYNQNLKANNGMDSILAVQIDIDSIIDLPFIENEVEMQVLPLPFNNQYFSGNLYEINKNLIAQPFASNAGIYKVASQIYAPAGNKKDVYFGGDSPQIHGFFDAASLVMSKEIFDDRDFPLEIEASFFSREKIADYNEAYIWIGEANPLYYNTSTTVFPLNFESKTGLLIGGVAGKSLIFDLRIIIQRELIIGKNTIILMKLEAGTVKAQ